MRPIVETIDARDLNWREWPSVETALLSEKAKDLFERRRSAIIELIESGDMFRASNVSGYKPGNLRRLLRRCVARDPVGGDLVGFRALLPWQHIRPYVRGSLEGRGTAGLLEALFRAFPELPERLLDEFLGSRDKTRDVELTGAADDVGRARPKIRRLLRATRISVSDLRTKFLKWCRELGVPADGYPFTAEEGGIRGLQEWLWKQIDQNGRAYLESRYGEDAARNIEGGGRLPVLGFDERLVIDTDEYTIDSPAAIAVVGERGKVEWVVVQRFKVISARLPKLKAVLAAWPVFKREPNTTDFLGAAEAVIRPHQRRQFTVPGLTYPSGTCWPSEIPGLEWWIPDIWRLDNAKIHLSLMTRATIEEDLGCTINFGVVRRPKGRGSIEAWHAFLAGEFRKLASTTGTGPEDSRRKDPGASAVLMKLTPDHLCQIVELLAARFNVTPCKALKGKTPIEALRAWLHNEEPILRKLPEERQSDLCLGEQVVRVSIQCDIRQGKQPVVRYDNAVYIGKKLATMRSRNREECLLVLRPNDGSRARLYTLKGAEIDEVYARQPWNTPHHLELRSVYAKLLRQGKIRMATGEETPAIIVGAYLAAEAMHKQSSALELVNHMQRSEADNRISQNQDGCDSNTNMPKSDSNATKNKQSGRDRASAQTPMSKWESRLKMASNGKWL